MRFYSQPPAIIASTMWMWVLKINQSEEWCLKPRNDTEILLNTRARTTDDCRIAVPDDCGTLNATNRKTVLVALHKYPKEEVTTGGRAYYAYYVANVPTASPDATWTLQTHEEKGQTEPAGHKRNRRHRREYEISKKASTRDQGDFGGGTTEAAAVEEEYDDEQPGLDLKPRATGKDVVIVDDDDLEMETYLIDGVRYITMPHMSTTNEESVKAYVLANNGKPLLFRDLSETRRAFLLRESRYDREHLLCLYPHAIIRATIALENTNGDDNSESNGVADSGADKEHPAVVVVLRRLRGTIVDVYCVNGVEYVPLPDEKVSGVKVVSLRTRMYRAKEKTLAPRNLCGGLVRTWFEQNRPNFIRGTGHKHLWRFDAVKRAVEQH